MAESGALPPCRPGKVSVEEGNVFDVERFRLRGRSRYRLLPELQMLQDLAYDMHGVDHGNYFHLAPALGTDQWVNLIHPPDQPCPVGGRSPAGGGRFDLEGFVGKRLFQAEFFPLPPLDAGIKSIVPCDVFSAVRNVRCQFGKKLEGIENLEVPVDALDDLLGAVDDGLFLGKVLHLPALGVAGFDLIRGMTWKVPVGEKAPSETRA